MAANLNFDVSTRMRARAAELIPGGAHTYAKADDQYPVLSPGFIARGEGCKVWDVDGNEYIEYGMGNRAVGLGHAFPTVIAAARAELARGCNFTRPAAMEVAAAEQFLKMIPTAEMVKFCKDGSDATSGAVKIARAYTGRDLIAICGDQPFFSVDDWFIGSTAMHGGIPEATRAMTVKFKYNNLDSVRELIAQYPGQIACFILEAARVDDPQPGFLQGLAELVREAGAIFILDEMITGFRWHNAGAQAYYGVTPDLSTWGKALANGFSVSALAGKREYMRLGDLEQWEKPRVFLCSTTHGGETHGLAAAIATMQVYEREPVIEHIFRQGARLRTGVEQTIARHGLQDFITLSGKPCSLVFGTLDNDRKPNQGYRSLFLQELIKRGVLAPSLVVSYTHEDADIAKTIEAFDGALGVYTQALNEGYEKHLVGRPSQIAYRTFNKKPENVVANDTAPDAEKARA
ncbi:MAG: glutamate-1-semialdehyde 2,1-aminomutase [Hyphomonadaceae bacterium]|nr:glutamate-1-semialdehyde 2,1-aminomutase [Hyphomonadaceae bacterium]